MIQKRSFIKYLQYNFTDTTGIDSFDTELIANLYIFSPANYATLCICNDRNKNYSSGHHCQASVQVKQAGVERGRERDGKVVRRTEEYWGGKWGGVLWVTETPVGIIVFCLLVTMGLKVLLTPPKPKPPSHNLIFTANNANIKLSHRTCSERRDGTLLSVKISIYG